MESLLEDPLQHHKGRPLRAAQLDRRVDQAPDNPFLLLDRPVLEDGLADQAARLVHCNAGPVANVLQRGIEVWCRLRAREELGPDVPCGLAAWRTQDHQLVGECKSRRFASLSSLDERFGTATQPGPKGVREAFSIRTAAVSGG